MTDYEAHFADGYQFLARARYETVSHHDEGYAAGHYYMNWRQIHATDPTLGARFKLAMLRLEELMYALFGSPPMYDQFDTADSHWEWWKRPHPRCQWDPEQWWQEWAGDLVYMDHYYWRWEETAAFGRYVESRNGPCGIPPAVPVRSRSGDPALQYALAHHTELSCVYFPVGSVTRTAGAAAFDPKGGNVPGWPTLVQQRRNWVGEAVEVTWTPPPGAALWVGTAPRLVTNIAGTFSMIFSGGMWRATIPAQPHGTVVQWYIRAQAVDPEEGYWVNLYEPANPAGGAPVFRDPPADPHDRLPGTAYTYVAFTHSNYYSRGLPEFLYWLTPEQRELWRKNTDEWQFTDDEEIQPELINLCRFVLDFITARATTPADPVGQRWVGLYHSPRLRTSDECCLKLPIKWLWSGSNIPGHYQTGGKRYDDLAHTVSPLHTKDDNAGSHAARRTWRGVRMLFKSDQWYRNKYYGSSESWLMPYWLANMDGNPDDPEDVGIYECGQGAGLKPGDVIDPVHIEEIIQAVDYLVRYGCWMAIEQHTCKMTPPSPYLPGGHVNRCGDVYDYHWDVPPGNQWELSYQCCNQQCCDSREPLGGRVVDAGPIHGILCDGGTADSDADGGERVPCRCTPWPKPTIEQCQGTGEDELWCGHHKCTVDRYRSHGCAATVPVVSREQRWEHMHCDGPPSYEGCGRTAYSCEDRGPVSYQESGSENVKAWSAWVCGPASAYRGCDREHGNGVQKTRYRGVGPDEINIATYGPSFGNKFGDLYHCSTLTSELVGEVDLWFDVVSPQFFRSLAEPWWGIRDCDLSRHTCSYFSGGIYGPIPGFGDYHWAYYISGAPSRLCNYSFIESGKGESPGRDVYNTVSCSCSLSEITDSQVCHGEEVWVAVDLNLDGSGMPYLTYAGGGNDCSYGYQPHGGEITQGIPRLRAYDPRPCAGVTDPEHKCKYWFAPPYGGYPNCPCDTESGPKC